jgi:thermostable 8-oxoguanine DNA glycosylase
LKDHGIGCHKLKSKSLIAAANANVDLTTCNAVDLCLIHGIGPKTANCFLLHTRRNHVGAGIDTHVLKYLKAWNVPNVPKNTPTGKSYARLEQEFLNICQKVGRQPAELDLLVWNYYSGSSSEAPPLPF